MIDLITTSLQDARIAAEIARRGLPGGS